MQREYILLSKKMKSFRMLIQQCYDFGYSNISIRKNMYHVFIHCLELLKLFLQIDLYPSFLTVSCNPPMSHI